MVPIGFVSDHMEVLYDLDTEATAKAAELGLPVRRSATVGSDPRFAAAVRDLLLERAATERGTRVERCALGALGPSTTCAPSAAAPPGPNAPRRPAPTARTRRASARVRSRTRVRGGPRIARTRA